MAPWLSIVAAAAAFTTVFSQQYEGNFEANTLPSVAGASIEFFRIKDSQNRNSTLINYFSLKPDHDRPAVKRLVIANTAFDGLPDVHFRAARDARNRATQINPDVQRESAAIFVPLWFDINDNVQGDALVWHDGSAYAEGLSNERPASRSVSSFEVLDQVVTWFDETYPNLHEIVIAGHSLGGQAVHRYAAIGKPLKTKAKLVYWIADPSSYIWLSSSRPGPLDPSECEAFNDWRDGLDKYPNDYEADFVKSGAANVLARFQSRNFVFTHGLDDHGDDSSTCAPKTTGSNREERMLNFIKEFPPGPEDNVDYVPGVGHNTTGMFSSDAGVQRLFIDNINGDASRAFDMGPRQQAGDSPDPAPSNGKREGPRPVRRNRRMQVLRRTYGWESS